MNELFKELAEQAELLEHGHPVCYTAEGSLMAYQRFAELIIKECAELADECPLDYLLQPNKYPSTWIKQQFGL